MTIILASFFTILTSSKLNDKEQLPIEGVYNFSSGRLEDPSNSNYSNTEFEISDPNGLINFSISVAYGLDFTNKTVSLTNDIDYGASGMNWQPIGASMNGTTYNGKKSFNGTFNGNGYTISNLTCNVEQCMVGESEICLGLFASLNNATISSVRVHNSCYKTYNSNIASFQVGGIAGAVEGGNVIISNCMIDSIKLESNPNAAWTYFGSISSKLIPLGAEVNLTIRDCLVQNVSYKEGGRIDFGATVACASNWHQVGYTDPKVSFERIELRNVPQNWSYFCSEAENNGSLISNGIETIYNAKSMAATSLKNNNLWHIPPTDEFNDGWPYLKSFIIFNKWIFKGSSKGTINNGFEEFVLEIPNSIDISTLVDSQHHYFYGQAIIATPNAGYRFKEWTASADGKTFTAKFVVETYQISKVVIVCNNEVLQSQDLDNITINYNGYLTLPVAYKEDSFKISVFVGGEQKIEINISDGTKYVLKQFAIENISDYTINCQALGAYMRLSTDLGDNMQECQLAIELKYKTYGVEVS